MDADIAYCCEVTVTDIPVRIVDVTKYFTSTSTSFDVAVNKLLCIINPFTAHHCTIEKET